MTMTTLFATRIAVSLIGFVLSYIMVLRYYLHMFQLNGYKNNEQESWLKKNAQKGYILYIGLALGFVIIVFASIFGYILWLEVIGIVWLFFEAFIFNLYRKQKAKKPLVYTDRVKRLIFTDTIVSAIIVLILFAVPLRRFDIGVMLIIASGQFVAPIIANIMNKPIEKSINNGFINDAKKRLEGVCGIRVIGITGSYGKTSVKFYLNTLLRAKYNVLMTPESFNTPMGVVRTIREHLKPTHEIFLCEMGARYVGDIKEICDIVHPEMGIITSIGPQHLETFGDIEHIKSTKFELADAVRGKGTLFLNGDNEYILDKATGYDDIVFYHAGSGAKTETNGSVTPETSTIPDTQPINGTQAPAGYYVKDITLSRLGTEFTVVEPNGSEERFSMRLVGEHNIINVMGAIAVAHTLGIPLKDLKPAVRRLEPAPHRLQLIEGGLVTIIDDAYNSNPVGSKAAVETLRQFDGIRILITPGMVELGDAEDEYNYKFGTYAAACCDYILLVGENHTVPIYNGAIDSSFPEDKISVFNKLEDAVKYAYAIRGEGHKFILLENDLPDNY